MAFRFPRADAVLAALVATALVVAMLLWMYYAIIPQSVLGWVLIFVIGIPTWLLLERLGERIVAAHFFSRMGRAARIALAVPILILLLIIAGYVIHLGQRAISGA